MVTEELRPVDELRALRRVATLVAEGVLPEQLFAVVAEEVAPRRRRADRDRVALRDRRHGEHMCTVRNGAALRARYALFARWSERAGTDTDNREAGAHR